MSWPVRLEGPNSTPPNSGCRHAPRRSSYAAGPEKKKPRPTPPTPHVLQNRPFVLSRLFLDSQVSRHYPPPSFISAFLQNKNPRPAVPLRPRARGPPEGLPQRHGGQRVLLEPVTVGTPPARARLRRPYICGAARVRAHTGGSGARNPGCSAGPRFAPRVLIMSYFPCGEAYHTAPRPLWAPGGRGGTTAGAHNPPPPNPQPIFTTTTFPRLVQKKNTLSEPLLCWMWRFSGRPL